MLLEPSSAGAIFETNARGSSEYQAFMNFPSSASLLWQNFRVKQRIIHVEDLKNSFQVASAICELVAEGIVTIFVSVYPETLTIVKSMTLQHDVLVFTTTDAHHFGTSQQELNYSVNIIKLRPLKAPAIIDFVLDSGWEDVLYLYESQQANYRLRWILERVIRHQPGFTVDFRRLRSAAESRDESAGGSDGQYGLLQYVNSKTKYFQRKSIILDVTSSAMTKQALHHIEILMPERADFQFLIIGGDTKIVNSSVLRFGGINMTVISLLNFNSAAMRNYFNELYPRVREPVYLPTNLSYDAALLIDGLHALVEVLKLLNDPLSAEAEKQGSEGTRGSLTNAYKSTLSAPCLPTFVPQFTATALLSKIQQVTAAFPAL
nr:unnamed protein product [Spirometra erinaceieuropaei]